MSYKRRFFLNLTVRFNGKLAKQVKIRGVWGGGHAMQQAGEAILHKYAAPAEMPPGEKLWNQVHMIPYKYTAPSPELPPGLWYMWEKLWNQGAPSSSCNSSKIHCTRNASWTVIYARTTLKLI